MKTLIDNYVFNKTANQVIFTGRNRPVNIEQLLLITNVTTGDIIYNFADKLRGGTLVDNVLTLNRNTTEMSDTDGLQIFIETDALVDSVHEVTSAVNILRRNLGFPDSAGRLRINMETGGTLSTITTVSTVSNQTSMGGIQTTNMAMTLTNAGAQNLRSRIVVT